MDVLHLNSYAVEGFIHGDPRFPRNTQPNATKGAKNLINEAGFGSLTSSFSHDQATSLRVLLCISFVRLKIPKLSFMLVLWIVASLGHRPKHPFFFATARSLPLLACKIKRNACYFQGVGCLHGSGEFFLFPFGKNAI